MSLRLQLLGLGLLTLVLPWAGYRYVQVLEAALRDGLEQALLASAGTVAVALRETPLGDDRPGEIRTPDDTIYAHTLAALPELDGYRNDWMLPDDSARPLGAAGRFWAGIFERSLYLYVVVDDDALVYQRAPTESPYGDRIVLLPRGMEEDWLLVHTLGPGLVRPQHTRRPEFAPTGDYENRALAFWRETSTGYVVEVRLPLDITDDRLGVALVDVDPSDDASNDTSYEVAMVGSWPFETRQPDPLVYRPASLDGQGRRFIQPGRRMRIVDKEGWVLFDAGAIDPLERAFAGEVPGLTEQILRVILARGDPPYTDLENPPGYLAQSTLRPASVRDGAIEWYARGTDASAVVVAAIAITDGNALRGAVILEQSSDAILTLTNDALVNLMGFTLIASLLVAAGLLSYATYLSMRVRRLARAADTAMGPKGDIDTQLPGREARDEIGDLARSFTALLQRLRDHTSYLTSLKGKLAHELRTPLAVVSTSLENLEREPSDGDISPYLARLRDGTSRLDAILVAMSEATALEQVVAAATRESFVLDAVVRGCVDGYRDVYPDRRFEFSTDAGNTEVLGSPDLIAQMLDKLIDNAVGFSEADSTVAIAIASSERILRLTVRNVGPPLPASMRAAIFDSLVSVRSRASDRGHLGLGLYIVALIVEFHGGQVAATDLGDGVEIAVTIPRSAA